MLLSPALSRNPRQCKHSLNVTKCRQKKSCGAKNLQFFCHFFVSFLDSGERNLSIVRFGLVEGGNFEETLGLRSGLGDGHEMVLAAVPLDLVDDVSKLFFNSSLTDGQNNLARWYLTCLFRLLEGKVSYSWCKQRHHSGGRLARAKWHQRGGWVDTKSTNVPPKEKVNKVDELTHLSLNMGISNVCREIGWLYLNVSKTWRH